MNDHTGKRKMPSGASANGASVLFPNPRLLAGPEARGKGFDEGDALRAMESVAEWQGSCSPPCLTVITGHAMAVCIAT